MLALGSAALVLGRGRVRDGDRRCAARRGRRRPRPRDRASGDARALLLVVTIAASIAAYTLVDRAGIQHAGALTYFVLVLAAPCLVYPPLVGIARDARGSSRPTVVAAAVANIGSFALGLLALRHGPAAPVLAVRSSSIVIATLLAASVLAEAVRRGRLAGSVLVFAGVALLAL